MLYIVIDTKLGDFEGKAVRYYYKLEVEGLVRGLRVVRNKPLGC